MGSRYRDNQFKVNQWIAIDEYVGEDIVTPWGQVVKPQFDGTPLQVLAVSMPFLCVTDGKGVFSIDSREYGFSILKTPYVKRMTSHLSNKPPKIKLPGQPRKKRKKDPRDCPRCGSRRVERLSAPGKWIPFCPECGLGGDFEGGFIPQ